MTIYLCAGIPSVFHFGPSGAVYFSGALEDCMRLQDGQVRFEDYGSGCFVGDPREVLSFEGKRYRVVDRDGMFEFDSVREGRLYLEDENGKLQAPDEFVYALIQSHYFLEGAAEFVTHVSVAGERTLMHCRLGERFVAMREGYFGVAAVIDDAVYAAKGSSIQRMDRNLSEVWKTSLELDARPETSGSVRSWRPMPFEDSVLSYRGHLNDETFERDGYAYRYYKRGILCAVAQADGSLRWQREFEWSVEDMVLHQGRLYLATSDRLERIDPRTGKTELAVHTGLEMPGHRGATHCLASLHIEGERLFYLPAGEPRILVYELPELKLHKSIELPELWCPREFQRKAPDGRLFLGLQRSGYAAPALHGFALLELHPDRLDEPVRTEPQPEVVVALRPSETEAGKEELWVELSGVALDDALRHGELHTQNQAFLQGWNAWRAGNQTNPNFNGRVHFRYFGPVEDAEGACAKLRVMEQRFAIWNQGKPGGHGGESMYAGDGSKRLCTLDAQWGEAP